MAEYKKPKWTEKYNYIVVATSIKKSQASASEILHAYSIRWQVELYFKRLKSLLSFGDIPTKTPENTETCLHGKLLAAILLEIQTASVDFSLWVMNLTEEIFGAKQSFYLLF